MESPTTVNVVHALPAEPPLSALEARVLGCLIEKELTTPDVCPLTLNSLVNACNQRNNRDPVLDVAAREVETSLESLRHRRLAAIFSGADARVDKYRQTLDLVYPLEPGARVVLCELLLRGPQTTAELRTRTERMQPLTAEEIETLLQALANRPEGTLVRRLPRQRGQKEARWAQLLTGEPAAAPTDEPLVVTLALPPEVENRMAALEREVAQLRNEIESLRQALGGN
ncbi:MAG: DUF480 domain-containing protein [Verrucomicrobiota bacterium]